jgi:CRP-like cAMP-binding protein
MTYKNCFLGGLAGDESALFKPHLVEVSLKVGQRLHRAGEPVEHIYFPHTGIVSLVAPTSGRAAIQGALVGLEGVVGGLSMVGLRESFNDATVQVAGTASRMAADKFCGALQQGDDRLRERLMRCEFFNMAQAQQSATCNALHSAEARVCRTMLEMHDRLDGQRIPLTQAALAANLGIQRTTVTLFSSKLQKAGALLCRRGYLHLLDRSEMERRACQCYAQLRDSYNRLVSTPAYLRPVTHEPAQGAFLPPGASISPRQALHDAVK